MKLSSAASMPSPVPPQDSLGEVRTVWHVSNVRLFTLFSEVKDLCGCKEKVD